MASVRGLALLLAIACVSCEETPSVVDTAFDGADVNHDGTLSRDEFAGLTTVLGKKGKGVVDFSIASLTSAAVAAKGVGAAFLNSLTMIIATELGDKTFCIAAVMAMRYNRLFVFFGAIMALIVMTILSVGIGVAVPTLLPKSYTHYAAALLFAYFGYKLIREAWAMTGKENHEELAETEAELGGAGGAEEKGSSETPHGGAADAASATGSSASSGSSTQRSNAAVPSMSIDGVATVIVIDDGATKSEVSAADEADPARKGSKAHSSGAGAVSVLPKWTTPSGAYTLLMHYLSKDLHIITQAFTLTFLAEWGDRSQIATIAMAAAQDWMGVTLGGVVGHSLCTGLAVLGGRMLASRISERTVAWVGGLLFVAFAIHSVLAGPEAEE